MGKTLNWSSKEYGIHHISPQDSITKIASQKSKMSPYLFVWRINVVMHKDEFGSSRFVLFGE